MVIVQEVTLRMGEKLTMLEVGKNFLLMRQEFELEETDQQLELMYRIYCVDLDTRYLPDL